MIIDLTGIACSVIAAGLSFLAATLPTVITRKMTDQQAAAALANAVRNSIGALQQQGTLAAKVLTPAVTIPGVPDRLQPAVQYVLDHAGTEADRLGVTPEKIAGKVMAQVGLAQIAANTAVAASSAPIVPDPLGPLAATTTLGRV